MQGVDLGNGNLLAITRRLITKHGEAPWDLCDRMEGCVQRPNLLNKSPTLPVCQNLSNDYWIRRKCHIHEGHPQPPPPDRLASVDEDGNTALFFHNFLQWSNCEWMNRWTYYCLKSNMWVSSLRVDVFFFSKKKREGQWRNKTYFLYHEDILSQQMHKFFQIGDGKMFPSFCPDFFVRRRGECEKRSNIFGLNNLNTCR